MPDIAKVKKYLFAGAIVGGILSLSISLLMDYFYADTFEGTWRDAIAKDLNNFFSLHVSADNFIVYIVFIIVLAILSIFGAFLGFIFSFFVYKFFGFLSNK